jgi:hypothetical protein
MNIFILHYSAAACAMYHCNAHCIKMILELAQLLSTAHCVLDGVSTISRSEKTGKLLKPKYSKPFPELYKPTHINHPCAIWVRESSENYKWLFNLFLELCDEYTYRYDKKIHLCDKKFRILLSELPKNIPMVDTMTPFRLAMPDDCKVENTVESYRNYYRAHKIHIAKWKKRENPDWF